MVSAYSRYIAIVLGAPCPNLWRFESYGYTNSRTPQRRLWSAAANKDQAAGCREYLQICCVYIYIHIVSIYIVNIDYIVCIYS